MQTMMAPSTLVWACSFIFLGFIHHALAGKNCSIEMCLLDYKNIIPQCNEKSKGYLCLEDLYQKCRDEKLEPARLKEEWLGYKLAEEVVCAHSPLRTRFQHNVDCWYGSIQCSRRLGFSTEDARKANYCHERLLLAEDCVVNVKLSEKCTDENLVKEFVSKMFQASRCGGNAIAVQLMLVIAGTVLALYSRI